MAEFVETSSVSGGSEAVYDFYCELCNEDGLHVEAEGFCSNCGEYLCGQCITYHKKTRITRYHKVLDKNAMPTDTPSSFDSVREVISAMCQQHKGKMVEFYCKSHAVLGCSSCFLSDHRSCKNIENITEVSKSIFDSQDYKDFKQTLALLEQQARDIITKSRDNLSKADLSIAEAKQSLIRFRGEINSLLEELEASILAQMEIHKTDIKAKEDSISSMCTSLQDSIEQITSEFESMESSNRVCQTYIRMKETTTYIQDIERQLRQIREDSHVKSIKFLLNEDLRKLLTGPGALGVLSMEDRIEPDTTHVIQTVDSASFVQDINVRSTREKKSFYIIGSAVLSENKLVVVDHNNCKIKLINTHSMKVISELQVPKFPWDVTVIKENQIAVSNYNYYSRNSTILFLNVTDAITKEREITVDGWFGGIVYSRNQIIVTNIWSSKVEIMDLQGHVTRRIESDKEGNKLFISPQYVCVSSDGDTIYVSDYAAHSVISLSRDGDVKAIYTDSNLKNPTQVCLYHRGNVFVCGRESKNIHMITPDCSKIKEILTHTDGLTKDVQSVSHCSDTDRLYVGMDNCDRIKVYQLS